MRIYIDTEFWERGPNHPIQLISLALVSEVGHHLYLVNTDFNWAACTSQWLHDSVKPNVLSAEAELLRVSYMAGRIEQWLVNVCSTSELSFWGYYSDYDWVVFCQLFGAMVDLPSTFPMYCLDLKQLADSMGVRLPKGDDDHNALQDACWIRSQHDMIIRRSSLVLDDYGGRSSVKITIDQGNNAVLVQGMPGCSKLRSDGSTLFVLDHVGRVEKAVSMSGVRLIEYATSSKRIS